jgi:hypothetical protein
LPSVFKSRFKRKLDWLLLVAGFLLLAYPAVHADRKADEWFIDPGGEKGVITRSTTETELIQRYGAKNVKHDEMGIGEGQTEPATFLYIRDPERSIAISWKDKVQNARPGRIQIDGNASKWHTFGNVTLGTSLKELEKLNGGPFLLSGFEWDYNGTVTSWNKGKLEEIFGHGRVWLRLNPVGKNAGSSVDYNTLLGEGDFSSANPAMQRLNPRVYEIIWGFQ